MFIQMLLLKDYISDAEEKMEEEEGDKLDLIIDKLDEHKQHEDEYVMLKSQMLN